MSPILRRLPVCALLATLWAVPPLARAAPTPSEELLRFVPADVTFCFVLRDLRGHAAAVKGSPLAEHLRRSALGQAVRAVPEWRQIDQLNKVVEKFLGLDAEQLRDDILGDAVVLAYRAGPPGRPQEEQGLVLVRARDAKRLAALVTRVNTVLRASGELKKVEEREHDGVKYYRRVERKEENFYLLRGPVLVFSSQEVLLREGLAREKKLPAGKESPVGRELRLLGADRALMALWLNPRAFDAALAAKLARAAGNELAFLKTFVVCWKGLDGIAFTFDVAADVETSLAVRGRPEALPAAVRRFLDEAAGRSDVWGRFPENALLALGARLPAAALLELLGAFQTREAFEALKEDLNRGLGAALDRNVVADVLPHLGPDWGLCVSAPPRDEKSCFPSVVFALRVGTGDKGAPVDQALVDGLRFYARMAMVAHNMRKKDPLSLKTDRQDKVEVHYLASARGQATGVQPAFGLWGGYVVVASSPEAFRRFSGAAVANAPASGEVPLLRLSLKDVRQYLADRRDAVAGALAEQHRLAPEEVGRNLDNVVAGLKFFDRLELAQKTSAGRFTLTLRLRPSLPLRK